MKLYRYFSFWFTLLALSICLFNGSGADDKNLLLYFTTPALWFLNDHISFIQRFLSEQMLMGFFYCLSLLSWYFLGLLVDTFVHSSKRKKLLSLLLRTGSAFGVILVISVIFYTVQNTETKIRHIIQNPNQYNEQSVQYAVVKLAQEEYGGQYIEELAMLLQSTNSGKVYRSTIYVLGTIGTPASVQAIMEHYKDKDDVHYALVTNENTIIAMLDPSQSESTIAAGIEATALLGFDSFLTPLSKIVNEYPSTAIQKRAAEALEQIRLDPKNNNPKFNID